MDKSLNGVGIRRVKLRGSEGGGGMKESWGRFGATSPDVKKPLTSLTHPDSGSSGGSLAPHITVVNSVITGLPWAR